MALSGLDAVLWDALADAAGLPLATFLGARPRPIPAYNSSGLGLMSPEPSRMKPRSWSLAGSSP
jgi:mandelate racemase